MTRESDSTRRKIGTVFAVLILLAAMLPSGVAHLMSPDEFAAMVPAPLPAHTALAATGILHLLIAVAAVSPRTRPQAGLAFAILCAGYLPLHLWDYVRPDPVFAPPVAASLRVAIQLVLIWIGWRLWGERRPAATQP
jgi:uncharacterized membrane protein